MIAQYNSIPAAFTNHCKLEAISKLCKEAETTVIFDVNARQDIFIISNITVLDYDKKLISIFNFLG